MKLNHIKESKSEYPLHLAPRGDTIDEYLLMDKYKVEVPDPYRFLEDTTSSATQRWIEAQNNIMDDFRKQCTYRDRMKDKFSQIYDFSKRGIPMKHGDHYYFFYNSGLQNQFVMYRIDEPGKMVTEGLEGASVFLDLNLVEKDGTAALGSYQFSHDGKYFAYMITKSGSDWSTIYVKDTKTGKDLEKDVIPWIKFSGISWMKDNKGFFYSKYDRFEKEAG